MTAAADPLAPTVVVLAAGRGVRFGGDKPFAPAGPHGEPLLAYALHDARKAGAGDAVLVVREADVGRVLRLADEVLSRILPVRLAVQRPDDGLDAPAFAARAAGRDTPWGTGHALLAARREVDRALVVLNGDDFYGDDAIAAAVDFARALEGRRRDGRQLKATGALVGFPVGATLSPRGAVNRAAIRTAPDGRVLALDELRDVAADGAVVAGWQDGARVVLDDDTLVSMNCWALPQAIFALLADAFRAWVAAGADGEFQLPTAITALIDAGTLRLMVRRTSGRWFGLTHAADLPDAQARLAALVEAQAYPAPLGR